MPMTDQEESSMTELVERLRYYAREMQEVAGQIEEEAKKREGR